MTIQHLTCFADRVCKLPEGGTIYLLTGMYPQKVEFIYDPSPKSTTGSKNQKSENKTTEKKRESKKRPASESIDSHQNLKKPRKTEKEKEKQMNTSENGSADKTVEEDEEDIKKLEEKLKLLKKNAADKKFAFASDSEGSQPDNKQKATDAKKIPKVEKETPSKSSSPATAIKSPSKGPSLSKTSPSGPVKKSPQKSEGPPAEETKWQQFEKLYVCTRKGVRARNKVNSKSVILKDF